MKLCYNFIMKILVKLVVILTLLISSVQAASFDVLVLPSDLLNTKENYYGFDEVSEIIANDIINDFNSTNGEIKSPDLFKVREKINQNTNLKTLTSNTLKKYKQNNSIDYQSLKEIDKEFSCNSVLLISSYVTTNKNSLRRSLWEILDLSTSFNTEYPYKLETSIVLIDTINDIVMWSNHYSTKIGANDNSFEAKNYAQANEKLEQIKLYSEKIVSKSASQNIILRFFPKSLRTLNKDIDNSDGGALKFERKIPQQPKETVPDDDFFGDMIYDI